MTSRSRLALIALASAVALTSVDLRPAEAASNRLPAAQTAVGDQDVSAARKRRVARRNAVPLAAFGAIVGTIGAIAAEQRRRDYYERQYAPHYGYAPPPVVYHEAPVYHAPRHYAPHVYHAPRNYHAPGHAPQFVPVAPYHVPRHHGPGIVNGHWQPPGVNQALPVQGGNF